MNNLCYQISASEPCKTKYNQIEVRELTYAEGNSGEGKIFTGA